LVAWLARLLFYLFITLRNTSLKKGANVDKNFYKDEKEKGKKVMKRDKKIIPKKGKNKGFSSENIKNSSSEKTKHKSSAST